MSESVTDLVSDPDRPPVGLEDRIYKLVTAKVAQHGIRLARHRLGVVRGEAGRWSFGPPQDNPLREACLMGALVLGEPNSSTASEQVGKMLGVNASGIVHIVNGWDGTTHFSNGTPKTGQGLEWHELGRRLRARLIQGVP